MQDGDPDSFARGGGLDSPVCVFCGGRPLTREHLWPDWLRAYFGDPERLHRHGSSDDQRLDVLREWTAKAATQTARITCKGCNNEWGSSMEDDAKPLLLPMISGKRQRLSQTSQRVISTWAAHTMMVIDHSHSRTLIPDEHLALLRQTDNLPAGTVAWISAYSGSKYAASCVVAPSGDDGWAATLQTGRLVIQMYSRTGGEEGIGRLFRETRDWNIQVWPPRADRLMWPPRNSKNDDELERVAFPEGVAPDFR